jgi:hypothetical protein
MSKRRHIRDSVLGAVICTVELLVPLVITAGNFLLLR